MENRIMSAVKAIICCHGRILLLKSYRNDSTIGEWEFPGGKIEFGETPEDALKRQVNEETGLSVRIREIAYISSYLPKENEQLITISYVCTSNRDIIDLSAEHSDYMWVRPEKLYDNIGDNSREEVLKHYGKIKDFISREYV